MAKKKKETQPEEQPGATFTRILMQAQNVNTPHRPQKAGRNRCCR